MCSCQVLQFIMGFDSTRNVYGLKKNILEAREHPGEGNAFISVATLFGYEYIIRKNRKAHSLIFNMAPL